MAQKIELIAGQLGTVLILINGDHYATAPSQLLAWQTVALHLAKLQGVEIVSFLK